MTSRVFHFWNQFFASCDRVCPEDLGPEGRRENPTTDLGTNKRLNFDHVVLLTSSEQIQHLLVRVGYHWTDGVKYRHKTIQQFGVFGQLDHGKPIDGFAVWRLGKGE
jgi:hypothetical protein